MNVKQARGGTPREVHVFASGSPEASLSRYLMTYASKDVPRDILFGSQSALPSRSLLQKGSGRR